MFCTVCGAPLQAGQQACARCGTRVPGAEARPAPSRVETHLKPLAVFYFVLSGLRLLVGLAALFVAETILPGVMREVGTGEIPPEAAFVPDLVRVVGWLIVAWAGAGFLAGYGLLQRAPWARTLALVLAFFNLLDIPFGTAVGVYAIWVLLSAGAEQQYARLSAA